MPAISNLPSGQSIFSPRVELVSVATEIYWDLKAAQKAYYIATENATLMNPTNMADGFEVDIIYIQNAVTAKTLSFDTAWQPSDNLPLVTTALNSVCYMKWECWDGEMLNTIFRQNLVI